MGDADGLAQIEEAIRVAEAANAPFELTRAKNNLAVQLEVGGQLEAALALWQEALDDAERFGQVGFARWFRAVVIYPLYALGRWREALAGADAFIAEVEAGSPHYGAPRLYATRALIRVGHGEVEAACADAARAIELVRRASDPQNLLPIAALVARVYLECGDGQLAAALATEYLDALTTEPNIGYAIVFANVAAITLVTLGHAATLQSLLKPYAHPWAAAARAVVAGAYLEAGGIAAATGAHTEEAFCQLVAARLNGTTEQLEQARAFYDSVGANRYARECAALLTAKRPA